MISRLHSHGWILFLLGLSLIPKTSLAQNGDQQSSPTISNNALQHGTLEVWVPGTVIRGRMDEPGARIVIEYNWTRLLEAFRTDFPSCDLQLRIFDRDEFGPMLISSEQHPPDVAFLDNQSQRGPLEKVDAMIPELPMAQSRFGYNGWWRIFRRAKHPEASKAFLLWLGQSPHWTPWQLRTASLSSSDVSAVKSVATDAVRHLLTRDIDAFSLLMDPDAKPFDWPYPKIKQLSNVEALVTFGTSRLGFALVSAVGEGDANFGMSHYAMILRKAEERWKVLLLMQGSLPQLEHLLQSFDAMGLVDGEAGEVQKVTILFPPDHSKMTRWPTGEIEWTTTDPQVAAYVVESQFGLYGSENWSSSAVKIFPPLSENTSIHITTPFGVGFQPHRWRVWAIGRTGVLSFSEWRTIDFTN
jgi:hypothetical protein